MVPKFRFLSCRAIGAIAGLRGAFIVCLLMFPSMSTSPVEAATDQAHPAVAFDGTNYFVVWEDSRTGTYADIYGARVSTSGLVLDTGGIAVSTEWNEQARPAVAFDGTNYMVAWHDYRSGYPIRVYFARVSTSGVLLDPGGIPVSTTVSYQLFPSIAFDGTNYLVVWQDLRNGSSDIYCARVSPAGVVLDPVGTGIAAAPGLQARPAVAFGGADYLVVWHDERTSLSRDIYGARVSVSGVVLNPGGIPISTALNRQEFPSVAFGGGNFFVAWEDDRSGLFDIYGSRVAPSGAVRDPAGIPISKAVNDQNYPDVVFDGTDYMVVWQDFREGYYFDVYGARVGVSGAVLDTAGIQISTAGQNQLVPAVAFDGTACMVVWQDNRGESYDVYAARVTPSGAVLDPDGLTDLLFTSVSSNVENGCVSISWVAATNAPPTSFYVERSDSRDGQFEILGAPVVGSQGFLFSCVDCSVIPGATYWYRIVLAGPSGQRESYGPIQVHVDGVPLAYSAHQSYPNPFNPYCTIGYELPEACSVSLRVFDVEGSVVRTLVDCRQGPGVHKEVWDGCRDDGTELPSGVYFYSIQAGEFIADRKMVLLR